MIKTKNLYSRVPGIVGLREGRNPLEQSLFSVMDICCPAIMDVIREAESKKISQKNARYIEISTYIILPIEIIRILFAGFVGGQIGLQISFFPPLLYGQQFFVSGGILLGVYCSSLLERTVVLEFIRFIHQLTQKQKRVR